VYTRNIIKIFINWLLK